MNPIWEIVGRRFTGGFYAACGYSVRQVDDFSRFANEETLEEIYRVLVPGGTLGLIWNAEDCLTFPNLLSYESSFTD